jgi:hypothetical protein
MNSPSPLLHLPTSRGDRWRLIEGLISQWFPDVEYNSRVPPGNVRPATPPAACPALQEWFRLVRDIPNVWCKQDELFHPHGYTLGKDCLIVGIENQSCAFWGVRRTDLNLDDPPVFIDSQADGNWVLENSTTSEFALTWLVSCIKWSQRNRAWAIGSDRSELLTSVIAHFPRLGLSDWHWPVLPTRYYGTADLILEVYDVGGSTRYSVATRTASAFAEFQQLATSAGISWDSSSDDWPDGWVNVTDDLA